MSRRTLGVLLHFSYIQDHGYPTAIPWAKALFKYISLRCKTYSEPNIYGVSIQFRSTSCRGDNVCAVYVLESHMKPKVSIDF